MQPHRRSTEAQTQGPFLGGSRKSLFSFFSFSALCVFIDGGLPGCHLSLGRYPALTRWHRNRTIFCAPRTATSTLHARGSVSRHATKGSYGGFGKLEQSRVVVVLDLSEMDESNAGSYRRAIQAMITEQLQHTEGSATGLPIPYIAPGAGVAGVCNDESWDRSPVDFLICGIPTLHSTWEVGCAECITRDGALCVRVVLARAGRVCLATCIFQ